MLPGGLLERDRRIDRRVVRDGTARRDDDQFVVIVVEPVDDRDATSAGENAPPISDRPCAHGCGHCVRAWAGGR
jgi:hypothetical protein